MKKGKEITQEEVRERFEYINGGLYYRYSPARRIKKDMRFGGVDKKNGYRRGQIYGKNYPEHTLIFLYHHGYLAEQIDHINRDKLDNRLENLREATYSQQRMNEPKFKGIHTSKYKGVYCKTDCFRNCPWVAEISKNKKTIRLGYFSTEIEAALARNEAVEKYHGEFGVLNDILEEV